MRDRRQFLDRSAAALWPSYRRRPARVRAGARPAQRRPRGAAARRGGLDGALRRVRGAPAPPPRRLRGAAHRGARRRASGPGGRATRSSCRAGGGERARTSGRALAEEIAAVLPRERAAGRSLAGPHRDAVDLRLDGRDVAEGASSGQARSLLLALALASLRVYREETGRAAVALLDDLDSELDGERAGALCAEVARRGQALVTSAHPGLGGEPEAVGPDLPRLGRPGALCLTPSERTET